MKGIIILMCILGAVMYALIVVTATPNDAEEYRRYEEWKRKQKEDHTDYQWR